MSGVHFGLHYGLRGYYQSMLDFSFFCNIGRLSEWCLSRYILLMLVLYEFWVLYTMYLVIYYLMRAANQLLCYNLKSYRMIYEKNMQRLRAEYKCRLHFFNRYRASCFPVGRVVLEKTEKERGGEALCARRRRKRGGGGKSEGPIYYRKVAAHA